MTTPGIYLSTTIPYVNARPHLGFALELVQADVLARHYRQAGHPVRLQTGTDDNSLKNVLAAAAEGTAVADLVSRNSAAFEALAGPLQLSFDDFIRTSSDPRHRPGVERFWRACADRGDLYRTSYQGLYCTGCEQFYRPAELDGGRCPEHGTEPEAVSEENWFFRLSKYAGRLREEITSGRLRIEPAARRHEVLAFIDGGLDDFSASRPASRAGGWGIPVPGDPDQVIYVWWDALGNYITSLGYGDGPGAPDFRRWWAGPGQRIHLAGKGVLRFHAVYWPAMLLSAGLPLPTAIYVHDYLTIGGAKISKSAAGPAARAADPAALAAAYGADAVRWWLLREVPRTGDADFTPERLAARADEDLANGLGNLVSRVTSMVHRYRDGVVPAAGDQAPAAAAELAEACDALPGQIAVALARPDFRAATAALAAAVGQANRCIEDTAPWRLARAAAGGDEAAAHQLDAVLAVLTAACRTLATELAPFLPGLSAKVTAACTPASGRLPALRPLCPRLSDRRARRLSLAPIRAQRERFCVVEPPVNMITGEC
jgi:methionyl-tRNA synthetase